MGKNPCKIHRDIPEKWVFQVKEVAGLGACLINLSNNTDVVTLPEREGEEILVKESPVPSDNSAGPFLMETRTLQEGEIILLIGKGDGEVRQHTLPKCCRKLQSSNKASSPSVLPVLPGRGIS